MRAGGRVQTELVIDGMSFVLADDEDLDALEERVQTAAKSGRFVRFAAAGHREARVFVTPTSRVAMLTEEIDDDGVGAAMSLNGEGNWDLL